MTVAAFVVGGAEIGLQLPYMPHIAVLDERIVMTLHVSYEVRKYIGLQ